MSDPKENSPGFFRKVLKFAANPTTDWSDLASSGGEESRENEFAKSELKAMIERKKRNDFVRKREFDVLRKVRREGLTSEQLAILGGSSRMDDSEAKLGEGGARAETGVKAKIDEIEQQMVGNSPYPKPRRATPPTPAAVTDSPSTLTPTPSIQPSPSEIAADQAKTPPFALSSTLDTRPAEPPPKPKPASVANPLAQELSEVTHDPELDEAVIAFANADFEQCEQVLAGLTAVSGNRAKHAETWLVLFDLYRAIGQQAKFENLALGYAEQFGWSAPQWFSMPKMVAESKSDTAPKKARPAGQVGWVCPERIEVDEVARLASLSLQMPLPWVFDWSALRSIDTEAGSKLSELFRNWMTQNLDIRWLSGERLFAVLQEAAPTGVRDVDPMYWQVRLDALRMTNRPDQFDDVAIDYCVTYEVSPPSWEPVRCMVRVSDSHASTSSPALSQVSDVSTSFLESHLMEEAGSVQVGSVELSGQLVGDIGPTLAKMEVDLGTSNVINISCARLIRVDFIAAGDLLNWVLARRTENRTVRFIEAQRLVALFFGAMGINEHAKVKVRIV
jgi:hypothetical protein